MYVCMYVCIYIQVYIYPTVELCNLSIANKNMGIFGIFTYQHLPTTNWMWFFSKGCPRYVGAEGIVDRWLHGMDVGQTLKSPSPFQE